MTADTTMVQKALSAARARIQDCRAQINAYTDADEHLQDGAQRDEELQYASEALAASTRLACASVRIAIELLGLERTLESFDAAFDEVVSTLGRVVYFDEYYGAHNGSVDF